MNESKTNIGYILFLSIVAALGGFYSDTIQRLFREPLHKYPNSSD